MNNAKDLKKNYLSRIVILIIALAYIATNFYHHKWTITGENRGVIKWDVISYYGYLPATFIYNDVTLSFIDDEDFINDNRFWFVTSENGNKVILTSMGVSFMYAPFFFIADLLAPLVGQEPDGFSSIYQFFLVFSSLVYVIIAFSLLFKILRRFFSEKVSVITLFLIGLGTNIYYYTTYESAMSHAYSFSLIILFFYLIFRWYENPVWFRSLLIGVVFGVIVLIRPSNIMLVFILAFIGVCDLQSLVERLRFLIIKWPLVLLMIVAFIIPWVPQFLYWHKMTGNLFYNAYEQVGSAFFFDAPQVTSVLFSFRKGWFIYVPIMFFAVLGFVSLFRIRKELAPAILVYLMVMVYIFSSWWSWWTGGSFGPRSFVDFYGILAIPLAALVTDIRRLKPFIKYISLGIGLFLAFLNIYQSRQYSKGLLHWTGMTKEAYKIQFLKDYSNKGYWQSLSIPDFPLARKGVYYFYSTGEDYEKFADLDEDIARRQIEEEIMSDKKLVRSIRRMAERDSVSYIDARNFVTNKIFEVKRNGGPR